MKYIDLFNFIFLKQLETNLELIWSDPNTLPNLIQELRELWPFGQIFIMMKQLLTCDYDISNKIDAGLIDSLALSDQFPVL